MNELDLPQISLGRYLELVSRRRWQVVPITLLGLVIGAVVAFLIPRYYVAETVFTFNAGTALDPDVEDPMAEVAENAQLSIPAAVHEVLPRLGWTEALDEDEDRRKAFTEAVRDRVAAMPHGRRGENFINLKIVYLDTNGYRAAELCNALRDHWIESERERLVAAAQEEVSTALFDRRQVADRLKLKEMERSNHRQEFQIDPSEEPREGVQPQSSAARVELAEKTQLKNGFDRKAAGLEAEANQLELELNAGAIPAKTSKALEVVVNPAEEEELAELRKAYLQAKLMLESASPNNERYAFLKSSFDTVKEQYDKKVAARAKATSTMIDNEDYINARKELASKRAEAAGLRKQSEFLQRRIDVLEVAVQSRIKVIEKLMAYNKEIAELTEDERELTQIARQKQSALQRLTKPGSQFRAQFEAEVPPAPTEPNIALVALLGCVLGLAAAIGLVFLLDFLQSSFKTVQDVERALPLPVLGMLSHLETEEERARSVSGRRRVSLAAGAFLFLSLSVVMIYYVDPNRLPPAVVGVFEFLLGTTP